MSTGETRSISAVIPLRFGHTLSFKDLLYRASHNPDVAQGLALAYAGFEPAVRSTLLRLIEQDAAEHPASLGLLMCHLLSAENDASLARDIARALLKASPRRASETARTWIVEDEHQRGKAVVGFKQGEDAFDVYALHWDGDGVTYAAQHRHATEAALLTYAKTLLPSKHTALDEACAQETLDRLCELLWRRRARLGACRDVVTGLVEQISL